MTSSSHKMKKNRSIQTLTVLAAVIYIGGCTGSNQPVTPTAQPTPTGQNPDTLKKEIIGKWKKDGQDIILEFTPDGRCVASSTKADSPMSAQGKYSFPSPGHVLLEVGKVGGITYSVLIKDKTLIFAGNGPTESYTRVK